MGDKAPTLDELLTKIEHRLYGAVDVEAQVERAVSSVMEEWRERLTATLRRETAPVPLDAANEVARELCILVGNARLSEPVRDALDAVLRALEGEPSDLTLLAQRIRRAAA